MDLKAQTGAYQRGMRGAGKSAQSLQRVLLKLAAIAGAALGGRALLRGAKDVLRAWAVQEEAVQSLRAALMVTGKEGEASLRVLTERASELQKVTTKGDEAIIAATASLALLAPALNVQELADAQKAIIGIADTFLKGDVQNAALLVGKSIGSTTNALTRYGIQIDVNASQSEKLATVLEKSAGFFEVSKQRTDTLAGATQQLSNVWGDLKEAIGRIIEQRTGLTEFLKSVTKLVADMTTILSGSGSQIREMFKNVGIIAGNAFSVAVLNALMTIPAFLREMFATMAVEAAEAGNKAAAVFALTMGDIATAAERVSKFLFKGIRDEAKANIAGAILSIEELADAIRKAQKDAEAAGGELGAGAGKGVADAIEDATGLIEDAAAKAGRSFISGFIRGTVSLKDLLVNAITQIAESWIIGSLEKELGIRSPSRAAASIGANVVEGLAGTAGGPGHLQPVPIQAGLVINQTINLSLAAIDGPSAAAFLRTQKGTIAELMGEAAQESPGFARMIRGR